MILKGLLILTVWTLGWFYGFYLMLKITKAENIDNPDYILDLITTFVLWWIFIPIYWMGEWAEQANDSDTPLGKFFDNIYSKIKE